MHKLYTLVYYNGKPWVAKVTVEEYGFGKENGKRFYNLRAIKISPAANTPAFEKAYGAGAYSGDDLTVADLFELVKKHGQNKKGGAKVPLFLLAEFYTSLHLCVNTYCI
ncbi:MAG: hypothetical protein IKW00_03930 [Clostridia bacterium]|nr:hypothetical protein [Clostridia bacterium]